MWSHKGNTRRTFSLLLPLRTPTPEFHTQRRSCTSSVHRALNRLTQACSPNPNLFINAAGDRQSYAGSSPSGFFSETSSWVQTGWSSAFSGVGVCSAREPIPGPKPSETPKTCSSANRKVNAKINITLMPVRLPNGFGLGRWTFVASIDV